MIDRGDGDKPGPVLQSDSSPALLLPSDGTDGFLLVRMKTHISSDIVATHSTRGRVLRHNFTKQFSAGKRKLHSVVTMTKGALVLQPWWGVTAYLTTHLMAINVGM